MYLQAVCTPGDKRRIANDKRHEQFSQIEEMFLKISTEDRCNTTLIPLPMDSDPKCDLGSSRQDFCVQIKRTKIVQQHKPNHEATVREILSNDKICTGSNNTRKSGRNDHKRQTGRSACDCNAISIEKSGKPFGIHEPLDNNRGGITRQRTTHVTLTQARGRSKKINSSLKESDGHCYSIRPTRADVSPRAKSDYANAANFLSCANNTDRTAEEHSFSVKKRAGFDRKAKLQHISNINVRPTRSPGTVVVNRRIEYQHCMVFGSREDSNNANSSRHRSSMSKNRERKTELYKADATTGVIWQAAPKSSTRRRISTSPDEGIVHSEMEDNEFPNRKDFRDAAIKDDRKAIIVEGGRTKESKQKRQKRGCHKIKDNNGNVTVTDESNPKRLPLKGYFKEKLKLASTSSKHTTSKVTKAEKAIARKVVRQALNDNSAARSYKPIWVELPKHSGQNAQYQKKEKGDATNPGPLPVSRRQSLKNHEANRPHNTVTASRSPKEVSRKPSSKLTKLIADRHRGIDVETPIRTTSRKSKDPVRTNVRNSNNVVNVSRRQRYHEAAEISKAVNPAAYVKNKRTVSADSSVRDLSYSSSSSDSTSSSSSNSKSTSSSTQSISSSSYSSRSYHTNQSSSNGEETFPENKTEEIRQTRFKADKGESSSRHKGKGEKSRSQLHNHWKKQVHCAIKDIEAKTNAMDLNSIRQATRNIEKSLAPDEGEEEFEIYIGKKREKNRKHQITGNDVNAKDIQKSLWQHQHLVSSSHSLLANANHRPAEKTKHSPESTVKTTSRYFEASTTEGHGAPSLKTIRDVYSLHNVLSDTQNGTVIAGHRRTDGMRVAIKRISKSETTRWGTMNGKVVPLELELLCQVNEIRHPGVVEIIEWHETTESYLLIMTRPHPSVDLYDYVTKQKRLEERVARRITKQLLIALLHCKKMGVLHRDVKLENILYNPSTSEAILIDFGCGAFRRPGPYTEFAGTPEYYPPEWFLYKQYNGDSATVWSIGVLVYSLLCGALPFRSSKDIINKELTKFPSDVSHQAKHFIREALKKKCSDRITLSEIINHQWLKSSRSYTETRKISV